MREAKIRDRAFVGATALVAAWAVFLNFFRLPVPKLLFDEPIYARAGWRYVHGLAFPPGQGGELGAFVDNFEHPPLAKYLFGLAQAATGGPGVTPSRAVAAFATLGTALVLGIWIGREAGRWVGLAVGASIGLLPTIVPPSTVRFGRFGMLDAVAGFLAAVCLVVGWRWSRSHGAARWQWAVAVGACAGLASSAKETGFLVIVGPVLLVILASNGWRQALKRVLEAAVAALAAVSAFVLSYLPVGHPLDRINYLVSFQRLHSALGHPTMYAGRTADHPEWWANLWFAWTGLGAAISVTLTVGVVAALVLRRDRLVAWASAALIGPIIFHFFVAGVALSFYWVMWVPFAFVLGVLGWASLLRWLATGWRRRLPLAATAVLGITLLLGLTVIRATATTSRLQATGVAAVATVMRQEQLVGPVAIIDVSDFERQNYLSDLLSPATTAEPESANTVIRGVPACGASPDRVGAGFLSLNLKRQALREVYRDAEVTIYKRVKPLSPPGYLDIISIKPSPRTC